LLRGALRGQTQAYRAAVLNNHGSPALKVGGRSDHIAIPFRLSKNRPLAEVVEEIKISSSRWIKTQGRGLGGLHWQNGYGGFSAGPSDLDGLVRYIEQQETHHRATSFQEEYRRFLQRYEVEYDERYVWD
jgi:putative transposase